MSSQEMILTPDEDARCVNDAERMAILLAKSNLLPTNYQKNPANVFVAIEYAKALNIAPMHAINSINVIKGKPTLSAGLMSALVRKHGCKLRVKVDGSGQQAVAHAKLIRPDDDYEFVCTWDMERAKRAGVAGGVNWQKYPEAMLKARAISEVCREGADDFLQGFSYTPEEMGGNDVQVSSVTVSPIVEPSPAPVVVETGEVVEGVPTADTPDEPELVEYPAPQELFGTESAD